MKIDRLVSMIMILLEKERVSAQELAEMFEVSPRTIYRDIDAINMAGIPIRSTSGVGGGFEIMQEYKIDKKFFSAADLSAILMGLSGLSGMIHGKELVNALAKVRSFIPAEQEKKIALQVDQICIDLNPWLVNRNIQPYLELIKEAMQKKQVLSFVYSDQHGNKTMRRVEPYQLVLKSNHWYFQGYCYKREAYRLFKLTRMRNLELEETTFVPRDYEKPILDFVEILDTLQTNIKIRIHKSVLDKVLEFCSYERVSPDGEDYYMVDFPFVENDYYYQVLLSFGDKCECLEPMHVRKELKRKIQKIAAIYGCDGECDEK